MASAPPFVIRPIRAADNAAVAQVIRDVMTEHGCTAQGFAIHDPEVQEMHANYRAPEAGYYVVCRNDTVLGGAGFAPLQGTSRADAICELRKMYYLPAARGQGLGTAMMRLLLAEMALAGYRRCYLETTSWMQQAQRLYSRTGFSPLAGPLGNTGHHGCDAWFSLELTRP